jgi:hypothetical protein
LCNIGMSFCFVSCRWRRKKRGERRTRELVCDGEGAFKAESSISLQSMNDKRIKRVEIWALVSCTVTTIFGKKKDITVNSLHNCS